MMGPARRVTVAHLWVAAMVLVTPVSAGALHVEEVAPGVFVHVGQVALAAADNGGDIANLGFIVGEEAVAVVDTGSTPAIGKDLRAAIEAVTDRPVRYVINTHMHPDHVLGNAAFRGTGPGGGDPFVVAHHKLARALAGRAAHYVASTDAALGPGHVTAGDVVLPDEEVEDVRRLDLGNRTIVLKAWPTAHSDNDLTVFDPATGTLFAGDLLFMHHLPVVDGSIAGWLGLTLEAAASDGAPVRRVVPGHGPAIGHLPQDEDVQRDYLAAVAQEVRAAIADGVPLGRMVRDARIPSGRWALAEDFHRRNLTAAFAELEWE
ncbi:quinoprotein relay system zinc metallohydrolase 2 [Acuticoccus yangtzensis]|uniref:quinoprotein relay system zinc metallohydrolase 2 n=1 Tax=Acuticoccus yangtzensis TaxID=1443441 RepID=UPI0009498A24|nr:quinoprotein relay system zinc metallohydrolase 2 [Acuticoccus yangtzensis]